MSILISKFFEPKSIHVTDIESHVDLIRQNIELNNAQKCCNSCVYDWLQSDTGVYDIILAFECVYKEELYEGLINSMSRLCHSNTIIFLGLTRSFSKPYFFNILSQRGFQYMLIPQECFEEQYGADFANGNLGLFVIRRN